MYNPIKKLRSVHADVANTLDIETAMTFVQKYHDAGGTGDMIFETKYGEVKVHSDETAIYVGWNTE